MMRQRYAQFFHFPLYCTKASVTVGSRSPSMDPHTKVKKQIGRYQDILKDSPNKSQQCQNTKDQILIKQRGLSKCKNKARKKCI